MKYEGVSFNEGAIVGHESADAVANDLSYEGLWPKITREQEQERLRQVYKLVIQKKGLYEDVRQST